MRGEDGLRMVSHAGIGASAFTGSRRAGMKLKEAADRASKPIYLEMSSINPVFVLPRALRERGEEITGEFATSCLMGAGQFCTNPGLVVVMDDAEGRAFVERAAGRLGAALRAALGRASSPASLRRRERSCAEVCFEVIS